MYVVFHIKHTYPVSDHKQPVCLFLEDFQGFVIGLIFQRLYQKPSSNSNLVVFSEESQKNGICDKDGVY